MAKNSDLQAERNDHYLLRDDGSSMVLQRADRISRILVDENNLLVPASAVQVYVPRYAVLVHDRAGGKSLFAGKTDLCFGETADAGESSYQTAQRGLREEASGLAVQDLRRLEEGIKPERLEEIVWQLGREHVPVFFGDAGSEELSQKFIPNAPMAYLYQGPQSSRFYFFFAAELFPVKQPLVDNEEVVNLRLLTPLQVYALYAKKLLSPSAMWRYEHIFTKFVPWLNPGAE